MMVLHVYSSSHVVWQRSRPVMMKSPQFLSSRVLSSHVGALARNQKSKVRSAKFPYPTARPPAQTACPPTCPPDPFACTALPVHNLLAPPGCPLLSPRFVRVPLPPICPFRAPLRPPFCQSAHPIPVRRSARPSGPSALLFPRPAKGCAVHKHQ